MDWHIQKKEREINYTLKVNIMRIKKILCLSFFVLFASVRISAQDVAVKTNLLYDATLTANAGIEFGLAPHWSIDLSGNYRAWTIEERKWKHWMAQPEARYWFCEHFMGHFLGVHLLGGEYNFGNVNANINMLGTDLRRLKDHRYQGWYVGAGVAYGYAFILGQHWNLELELGVGYAYTKYDKFECKDCGKRVDNGDHHYIGPTKAAINLVYLF